MISRFFNDSEKVRKIIELCTERPREVAKWVEESTVGQDTKSQGAEKGYRCDCCGLAGCHIGMVAIKSDD